MEIEQKFFPPIMRENDKTYFSHLYGMIESVDEFACVLVTKKPYCYDFRIATSLPKYNNMVIKQLIQIHNLFKIKLIFSKSIKTSGTIAFQITLLPD